MTTDRGGLQYRIEVVDDFSANLDRFRRQLRETRAEARDTRAASRRSRGRGSQEREDRQRINRLAAIGRRQQQAIRDAKRAEASLAAQVAQAEQDRVAQIIRRFGLERRSLRDNQRRVLRRFALERRSLRANRKLEEERASAQERAERDLINQVGFRVRLQQKAIRDRRAAEAAAAAAREREEREAESRIVRQARARERVLRDQEKLAARVAADQSKQEREAESRIVRQARARERVLRDQERLADRVAADREGQEATARRRRIRARRLIRQRRREQERIADAARREAEANERSAAAARRSRGFFGRLAGTLGRTAIVIGSLIALRTAIDLGRGFFEQFIGFNKQIESARLGIASIFTAVGQVTDAQGKTVQGARALTLAQGEARRQTDLLRRDALATTATFEELAEAFQQALAPGLTAGLNVDQIRQFSVRISQAAAAIGLPQNQLAEEIRSLLAGTITPRTTRIATSLGITNEDIRRAKQAGTLVEFLNQRFQAFDVAGKEASKTFAALTTNVADALRQLVGTAGLNLFNSLKTSLQDLFDLVTDRDPVTGEILPDPELVRSLEAGFSRLQPSIEGVFEALRSADPRDILAVAEGLGSIAAFALEAVVAVTKLGAGLADISGKILDPEVNVALLNLGAIFGDPRAGGEGPLVGADRAFKRVGDSIRSAGQPLKSFADQLDNVVNIGSKPLLDQAKALEAIRQRALGAAGQLRILAAQPQGRVTVAQVTSEVAQQKQLEKIEKARQQIQAESAAIVRRRTDLVAQQAGLSGEDSARVERVRALDAERLALAERLKVVREQQLEFNRERIELEEKGAALQQSQVFTRNDQFQAEAEALERGSAAAKEQLDLQSRQADNRARVEAILLSERQLNIQQAAAQTRLNALLEDERILRLAIARDARARILVTLAQESAQLEKSLISQARKNDALNEEVALQQRLLQGSSRFSSFDQQRVQASQQFRSTQRQVLDQIEEQERKLQDTLQLRKQIIFEGKGLNPVVEQNLGASASLLRTLREQLRILGEQLNVSRQLVTQAQLRAARTQGRAISQGVRLAERQLEATRNELQLGSEIGRQLNERAAIAQRADDEQRKTRQALRVAEGDLSRSTARAAVERTREARLLNAQDRANVLLLKQQLEITEEQAAVSLQLLESKEREAEQARISAQNRTPQQANAGGFGEENDARLQTAFDQAQTFAGQVSSLILGAFIVDDGEKTRVVNSYSSVFDSIGKVISDFFTDLKKNPLKLLFALLGGGGGGFGGAGGGTPTTEGQISSGFAEGGPVGGNLPRAAPLPGLSRRDVVPARLALGEYVQPTSAVQRYGPQVMEAIRRGAVDPFALRALAGANRSVRKPRGGGFQTGGSVTEGLPSPAQGGGGQIVGAVMVANEQQLANQLAGSSEEFLRFVSDNSEAVRSRLGL